MDIRYITIEREYGSGGSEIARKTAEKCNISCYGSEILEAVARRQHVSVETLQQYEESVSSSFLYSLFVMTQSQTGDPDLLSGEAKLFVAEARMIQELAKNGPAVFVGHCASQALRKEPGVLKVFIHADEKEKHRRITEQYGIPADQVEQTCKKFNRRRANYYAFCTQKKWNDLTNYDVVLDSSQLGQERCAAALAALFRE